MAKRTMYSFMEKQHSKKGKLSTLVAAISYVLFFIMVLISYITKGQAGLYAGAVGLSAMLLSIYGFVLGLRSFQETNCLHRYSKVGSILNGLALVGWLSLLLIGI